MTRRRTSLNQLGQGCLALFVLCALVGVCGRSNGPEVTETRQRDPADYPARKPAPSPEPTPASPTPKKPSTPAPAAEKPPAAPEVYPVARVIDGDTIAITKAGAEVRVRLIGVDTPETVHPSKPVEAFGKEASAFTSDLLHREIVRLEYDQERTDKYGRTLAYVYRARDELFVNAEIIRKGYGHAYTQYPFRHMESFRAYEREAREARRGLWGDPPPVASADPTPKPRPPPAVDTPPSGGDGTVYVTNTGKKYHRAGCRYLSKSCIPIALGAARARYGPCSVCRP